MKVAVYHKILRRIQKKWNCNMLRLPTPCYICRQYHQNVHAICQDCIALLEPLGPACRTCATPLPQPDPALCGVCSVHPPILDRVYTAYRYSEPLRTLLHAFKYEAALYLSSFITQLMLDAKDPHYTTECLIPIPLHRSRLRTRGFNQAAVLSIQLSRFIHKPYALHACKKILSTPAQAGLNANDRRHNLEHAFKATSLPYHHVTLVDDLLTTGATANEVARILKQHAGVQRVDLWCCARAC